MQQSSQDGLQKVYKLKRSLQASHCSQQELLSPSQAPHMYAMAACSKISRMEALCMPAFAAQQGSLGSSHAYGMAACSTCLSPATCKAWQPAAHAQA